MVLKVSIKKVVNLFDQEKNVCNAATLKRKKLTFFTKKTFFETCKAIKKIKMLNNFSDIYAKKKKLHI